MRFEIIALLLIASIIVPVTGFCLGKRNKHRFKIYLAVNAVAFFGVMLFATVMMFSGNVYAAEVSAEAAANTISDPFAAGMAFLSAGLVTGLCTIGTGVATGHAAAAALGALSENEGIMGKALIFVSMCEGIAVYGLLISFTILGRV
ncbi:MAG: ATP synthase subunit C [Clostridiales bacterium]|jgi:V/A-type H+-transporting ATPase subunit K|nr:ATP synthase subunit C [Clostridiales bacterium]